MFTLTETLKKSPSKYLAWLISHAENGQFDDFRHVAQNIATCCGITFDAAYDLVKQNDEEIMKAGLIVIDDCFGPSDHD